MIKIISIQEACLWDEIVSSFANYDVYYLSGYVKSFMIHGDGEPNLMYYESDNLRAIYVYMKRKTAVIGLFDIITPYGYGGVLFEGQTEQKQLENFWTAYIQAMRQDHIVDNFVRYHPVLQNAVPMKSISNVIDLGHTIAMDLASPEVIWENIASKNRNMIRKAQKNDVKILHGTGMDLLKIFIPMYNETMRKDQAEAYYFFGEDFYESVDRDLAGHYEVFYAVYDEKTIAAAIILFANDQMHYHLSGSDMAYRHLAPSNVLLYEAALWGYKQGFKTFHLGGGIGSKEDNLYKFKSVFNKNANYQFSIGKEIFNQELYDQLVEKRRETDHDFDASSSYFPLYRS